MNISATEFNRAASSYINESLRAPVIIERNGKPTAAIIDYALFERLEDAILLEMAIERDKEGSYLVAGAK